MEYPIEDFSTPEFSSYCTFIEKLYEMAQEGENMLVHCMGGRGRTGLVLAGLAMKHFSMCRSDAVNWIRESIPYAVESNSQMLFLGDYETYLKRHK